MKLKKKKSIEEKGKLYKIDLGGETRLRSYVWLLSQQIHSAHEEKMLKSIKNTLESIDGMTLKALTQEEVNRIEPQRLELTKSEIDQINSWRDRSRARRDQSGQQIGLAGLDFYFLEDFFEFCDSVMENRYVDLDDDTKTEEDEHGSDG